MSASKLLNNLLNYPSVTEAETAFFKDIHHDLLLETFAAWFRTHTRLNGFITNILNIQGIHDRGIDLIVEMAGNASSRIGVQVKCDNDLNGNLSRQIDTTLANYDTFNLSAVIFIFCCDYTNLSHKTKARQEIARIQQKADADIYVIVDSPKALSILRGLIWFPDFLKQLSRLTDEQKISFAVTSFEEHESGFVILNIESSAFALSQQAASLAKAYLSIILGMVAPDILIPGHYYGKSLVLGSCPIQHAGRGIRINEECTIMTPEWYMNGLEEHGAINLWGSAFRSGESTLQLFLQFMMTQRQFEDTRAYQLLSKKFRIIAHRLCLLGDIRAESPWDK